MRLASALALLAVVSTHALAQGDVCKPGSDTNEAKMLAYFATPLAFSPSGHAGGMRRGEVRVSFDATYIPAPSSSITSPEVCYSPNKKENTELSPVLPRPRVAIGLGGGFHAEAMYLPPVTVLDATPNMLSMALGYTKSLPGGKTAFSVRGHATIGEVSGPITCSKDVIQTSRPTGLCYATRPSDDTYKPNMYGAEGIVSFGGTSRWPFYLGAGFTSLRPRFQVGFVDANNVVDDTEIEVDLTRVSAFAGGAWKANPRFALTAELYSVPQDLTTIRLGGSFTLRNGR
jgi:hypothetical protein